MNPDQTKPNRILEPYRYAETPAAPVDPPSSKTPWLAIALFGVSLASIAGCVAVIVNSDGAAQKDWLPGPNIPAQPSVVVAVLSGIFNAAQVLALAKGIAIVWWRTAWGDTNLKTLHYIWNKGEWMSFRKFGNALRANRRVVWVVLVSVLTVATNVASNPLLQKATHTVIGDNSTDEVWEWWVRKKIPDGFTGTVDPRAPANLSATPALQKLSQDWYSNKTIGNFWSGICKGTCYATIRGAGFTSECNTSTEFVDLTADENANTTLFSVDFSKVSDGANSSALVLEVRHTGAVDSPCLATIHTDRCILRSTEVAYDIQLSGEEFAAMTYSFPTAAQPSPSAGDRTTAQTGNPAGPLSGLAWLGYYYLRADARLLHDNGSREYFTETSGISALRYSNFDSDTFTNLGNCVFQWQNATEYILPILHELMLRMAVTSASSVSTQNVMASIFEPGAVVRYSSGYGFLVAAVVLMGLTCLSTFALLWGFWELSGPVTLSPLETAMALVDVMSLSYIRDDERLRTADDLVERFGEQQLQRKPKTTTAQSSQHGALPHGGGSDEGPPPEAAGQESSGTVGEPPKLS